MAAIALYRANPETQATLRRSVPTAHYALFHYLIEETCKNWTRLEQRGKLATFEHKNMSIASSRRVAEYKNAATGSTESHLYSVACAFSQLQEKRHTADYDLSRTLSGTDVGLDILLVEDAFISWEIIRNEQIGQDYLFSLLFRERS
jgi:hypothetical protein